MFKRPQLAHALHATGALRAILQLRERLAPPWLSILTYHRFPPAHDASEPFDDGVVDATLEKFEHQVACLKKHFNVVGIDELCAFARGGKLPPNPAAITFDDGYLSAYENALPILKRHDCKAIFFIATSFIDERRVYWWDRVAYLLRHCTRDEIRIDRPFSMHIDCRADRGRSIRRTLQILNACSMENRAHALDAIARARMGQSPLGSVGDSHAMFAEDGDTAVRRPERHLTRLQIMAMDTLQLAHNATLIEIKARYKELVKRFHPDANGGDRGAEERLKQVIKAYGVLRASGMT